ncbi:hypothetical protein N8392_01720 [Candidatus Poseidonia sp.]|nr:hypothetical protein [Poseidonia sp.]
MVGHTNGSIGVWSTSDWTRTHLFEHHTSQVTALGFSPDGTMAASGDFNSDLRLWNTENWSLSVSDDVRYNSIHDVTFIDDNQLAVAYGGQLEIRTTDTLKETQTLFSNGQTQLRVVDLSPDRNSMMVGGETGSALLRYIDASTGGLLVEPQIHDRTVRAIATSNDGNLVATGADYQNATASGFGNYAGSAGYSLLWFIGDEFGFGVYREGIINIANSTGVYDWDNWGVQLCTATGSNIATIFDIYNIPLEVASVDHCAQYPEWADHPFVDTGTASGSGDKDE